MKPQSSLPSPGVLVRGFLKTTGEALGLREIRGWMSGILVAAGSP